MVPKLYKKIAVAIGYSFLFFSLVFSFELFFVYLIYCFLKSYIRGRPVKKTTSNVDLMKVNLQVCDHTRYKL